MATPTPHVAGMRAATTKPSSSRDWRWPRTTSATRRNPLVACGELLAGHAHNSAYQVAGVFAWRGEHDTAFEWLQRAVSQQDAGLQYLKYDPALRSLRGDPRYLQLLRQLHLPP